MPRLAAVAVFEFGIQPGAVQPLAQQQSRRIHGSDRVEVPGIGFPDRVWTASIM